MAWTDWATTNHQGWHLKGWTNVYINLAQILSTTQINTHMFHEVVLKTERSIMAKISLGVKN